MITFDQLIHLYRNVSFAPNGDKGELLIADDSVLETLKALDSDDRDFEDAAISVAISPAKLAIGQKVAVVIGSPRPGLGLFARDMEELLSADANRLIQPSHYYVASERFAYNDVHIPDAIKAYRAMLRLVGYLSFAASLVDQSFAEAIFLASGDVRVRFTFRSSDLDTLDFATIDKLGIFVNETIHKDQRKAILASNIIEICKGIPEERRFTYLLGKLKELLTKTEEGYKLFAAEFSYDKIKGKTEEALNEYSGKIHKTFFDIQNQIIGIPVATVIVATQLKPTTLCGAEFWANLAIALGASLFVILLAVAVYNQWMTLATIATDLARQKDKLANEYSSVAGQFTGTYQKLGRRVCHHRIILVTIVIVCAAGAGLTWFVFSRLTTVPLSICFA